MGYRQDGEGAAAAALVFTRLSESMVQMTEEDAASTWRVAVVDDQAAELVADVVARLRPIRDRWAPGEFSYRVAPLAVRVRAASPERASVDVWYVAVVAGRDLPAYQEWVTDTYSLVWERGDWRVASLDDAPGPRPLPGPQAPTSPAEFDARVEGFEARP